MIFGKLLPLLFSPIQYNFENKKDEIVSFEKQNDDLKKKLAKTNEAKIKKSKKSCGDATCPPY